MNRRSPLPILFVLLLAAGAAIGCKASTNGSNQSSGGQNGAPATSKNGDISFPLPEDPAAAIKASNLPELPQEFVDTHYHAHLDVMINGKAVTVPAYIGITKSGISPLHTHDDTGVIHIESQKDDTFTVGQLFTEWGVKLDKNCISTYCADDKNQLLGFVNGQVVADPASIPFKSHEEIVVWYGPKGSAPTVPSSYQFPQGS